MGIAALAMQYRDVKHVMPFVIQIGMYAAPIVYPMSTIPERFRPLYALNPMVGVIEGFRSVLLGTTAFPWMAVLISAGASLAMFVAGASYFGRTERFFADLA
jgi:lipopolysaccharide transport system permease protein